MSPQVHSFPDGGGVAHKVRACGRLCSVWWDAAGFVVNAQPGAGNPAGFKSIRKGGPVWRNLQLWVTLCRPGVSS